MIDADATGTDRFYQEAGCVTEPVDQYADGA